MNDEYEYYDREEFVHIDDIPDLSSAKESMEKLICIIYGIESMDNFEDTLEEVCEVLGLSLPNLPLKIKKEPSNDR